MVITHHKLTVKTHIVEVSGPLNMHQAEAIRQTFSDLSARGIKQVVVDLTHVPFMDGPGLAALVTGYKLFSRNEHAFQLTGVQDQPKLVLELTGFDHIFQVLEKTPAVTAINPPRILSDGVASSFILPVTALVDMAA